jgi:predicted phosphodiesterase
MRILIYSDVHGNLPAFEAMLKNAGKCDGYICLGDLVNYGPWSNECVDLAVSLPNSILLMGNHEEAYINGSYNGTNSLVNTFFRQTYPSFNRLEVIKNFAISHLIENYLCKHTIMDKYIYSDTTLSLDRNYIIGHSHHQFILKGNGYSLINAGSVGQNRKFINVSNYLIYDIMKKEIKLKSSEYNIDFLLGKMIDEKFPPECILYYRQKAQLLG